MSNSLPRRAGVIGWPISHSRSPLIHGYWLKAHGIEGEYVRFPIPPPDLPAFVKTIGSGGLRGANVTVPHKEAAFALCDRVTEAARAVGAVNTLWREDGRLFGDNTDIEGFLACLDQGAPGWRGQAEIAVVLGAGGAARAVAHALLASGAGQVILVNRGLERARALAAALGEKTIAKAWADLSLVLPLADLFVNTTSLGMSGQPAIDIDLAGLKASAIVTDVVYTPLRTALLDQSARRGHATVEGLGMLLHQAAPGFERWFGVRPLVTPELRALVEKDILHPGAAR